MENLLNHIKKVEELIPYIVYRDKDKYDDNIKKLKKLKKKVKEENYDDVLKNN